MKNVFQTRILAVVLAVATLAVCVFAALNVHQEGGFNVPTDGAWLLEAPGGLRFERVPEDSPAQRAGVRPGDILQAINDRPTPRTAPYVQETFRSGIWAHANYSILRPNPQSTNLNDGAKLDIQVILEPKDRSINQAMRFIALVYLCIGIYVLFRRWTAPKSTHFYIFCLVSFVLYAFKYTGKLDLLDQIVYWGNVASGAVQPALFLHFAVSFAATARRNRLRRNLLVGLLYAPGI